MLCYELDKQELIEDHEIYAYLCGVEVFVEAIQEMLKTASKIVKLPFKLESWEEDKDNIVIKYSRIDDNTIIMPLSRQPQRPNIPMMDIVEASTVFEHNIAYSDLISDISLREVPCSTWWREIPDDKKQMIYPISWHKSIESTLSRLQGQINGLNDRINNPKEYQRFGTSGNALPSFSIKN